MSPRLSWLLAVLVVAGSGALMALVRSDASGSRDRVPAIVVLSRDDGAPLHPADLDALRRTWPSVQVSGDGAAALAVVLALLTLVFASSPSVRSLGVQAAAGLVVAAVYVLLVLPPLLGLFGRRLFWPFVPRVGAKSLAETGIWHRSRSRWPAGRAW